MRGSVYVCIAVALGLLTLPVCGRASVHGQCSNCHTMHNSQNNLPMNYNGSYTTAPNPGGSAVPNDVLLRGNCLACHTGPNNGSNTTPYVYSTSGVLYTTYDSSSSKYTGNTLAGGNFYWVDSGTDADGHNVDLLPNNPVDNTLTSPPGYTGAAWDLSTNPLTCAGLYGCHGRRGVAGNFAAISKAHHADTSNTYKPSNIYIRDGSTLGKSFRFLNGIKGVEDPKWEYPPSLTSTAHNEYYGSARSNDSVVDSGTISSLCAQCHGAFHNSAVSTYTNANGVIVTAGIASTPGTMVSPWIRHPTDFNMSGLGGEYANYTVYDPMVPVGNTATDGDTTNPGEAYNNSDGAIVMCISCHRAHGSPYASLLRWDYRGWPGSGGYNGCVICHSAKD